SGETERKRLKLSNYDELQVLDLFEKTFVDFGTQVEKTFVDFGTQQCKELFSLTSGMRNEIYKELTNYLTTILEELYVEKNQETNEIDELALLQSQMGCIKKCLVCKVFNIDNKKQICPMCHNKLPTIAEINQQLNEPSNIINTTEKSLDIRSYMFEKA
ncbi:19271_t:CDS:2, partial [Cetraspora pellucida]